MTTITRRIQKNNNRCCDQYAYGNGPTVWEVRLVEVAPDEFYITGTPTFLYFGKSKRAIKNTKKYFGIDIEGE